MENWWANDPLEDAEDWWKGDPVDGGETSAVPQALPPATTMPIEPVTPSLPDSMTIHDMLPDDPAIKGMPMSEVFRENLWRMQEPTLVPVDEAAPSLPTATAIIPQAQDDPQLQALYSLLETANPVMRAEIERRIGEYTAAPVAPGAPAGDLVADRLRRIARGGTEVFASVPEAHDINQSRFEQAFRTGAPERVAEIEREMTALEDILSTGISPVGGGAMTPAEKEEYTRRLEEARVAYDAILTEIEPDVMPAGERAGFTMAENLRRSVAEAVGEPNPEYDGFWGNFFEGMGNMAGMAAVGLPTLGLGGVVTGSSMNASQIYKEAIDSGAAEADALRAAGYGQVVGMTEILPIMHALKPLTRVIPGIDQKITGLIVRKVGLNATEEAVQEAGQQIANNLIASGIYDPERGWTEGVGESAILGAALGGTFGGVGVLRGERGQEVAPETPAAPQIPAPVAPSVATDVPPVPPVIPEPIQPPAAPEPVQTPEVEQNVPRQEPVPQTQEPVVVSPAKTPVPQEPQKRPFTNLMKRSDLQIDPNGDVGRELKHAGVTPRTAPGLFRKGGIRAFDNIPANEHPEISEIVGIADDGLYLDRQGIIDALTQEAHGWAVRTPEQTDIAAEWDAYIQEVEMSSRPVEESSLIIQPPEVDKRPEGDRIPNISTALTGAETLLGVTLTPNERADAVDYLVNFGGDARDAVIDATVRSYLNEPGQQTNSTQGQVGEGSDIAAIFPTDERKGGAGAEGGGQRPEAARTGTLEGGRVDITPDGEQTVIPGAEKITDRERAERAQQRPMRGGNEPAGGLFDDDARNQGDMFDGRTASTSVSGGDRGGDAGRGGQVQGDTAAPADDTGGAPDGTGVRKGVSDADTTSDDGGSVSERVSPKRSDRVGRRPPGKLSPTFLKFSFNNRQSVYQAALVDAGLDPEDARLADVDEQITVISKMLQDRYGVQVELPKTKVRRKNRFGREETVERQSISSRKALDQLLDAYQNMQMLAATMGVPESAIGLPIEGRGITLSLVSQSKLRGALGVFSWGGGKRTIHLPERSNSFAHEWGHALDHYLAIVSGTGAVQSMMSRKMDKRGVNPQATARRDVTEAFAHVQWALYADKARAGELIVQMQIAAAETNGMGQPTQKAKQAQKVLDDMREGRRPPESVVSEYFKTSKEFDDVYGAGGYFVDAAEMFARAFEAWVGTSVSSITDLPQSFLSKGGWAYEDMNDERLAKTFPKDGDMMQFSIAMTKLSHAIARSKLFGLDEVAKAPEDVDVYSPEMLLKSVRGAGIASREMEEMRKTVNRLRNAVSPAAIATKMKDVGKRIRTMYQEIINTTGETMYAVAKRQESPAARQAFENIATKLAKRPGSGKLQGDIYQDQLERTAKRNVQKVANAIKNRFPKGRLTDADLRNLRLLLSGESVQVPANLKALAGDLRQVLNDIWYDLQDAGIKVGYAKDYLPHIYDVTKVDENVSDFLKRAKQVYGILFDNEITKSTDESTQTADINAVINGLRNATKATVEGDRTPSNRLSGADETLIDAWRKARRTLKELLRREEKGFKTESGAERNAEQIEDAMADLKAALDSMLGMLRDRFSAHAAEQWHNAMGVGQMNDYGSVGPTSSFLKNRTLPKEAGIIMQEFMQDNPIDLIQGYAFAAARRTWFAKLFGADGEKLKNMLRAARDAGASEADIDVMKMAVNAATGRLAPSGRGWQTLRTYTFTLGNLGMLPFAAFTSLAESAVTGMRTGQTRDSIRALVENVRGLVQRGRTREIAELASVIGLIAPYSMETVMENRLGADALNVSPSSNSAIQRFFIINGLTPLTHYQRIMGVPVAHHVIIRHLKATVRGKGNITRDWIQGGNGEFANGELNELGVAREDRADLLEWLEGLDGMPQLEDMYGPDGQLHQAAEIYARAINRLINEVIQNPLKTDRPIKANHPDYAALYGIMSFIDSFHRNILLRTLKRGITEGGNPLMNGIKMSANAALALAPFGVLLASHFLTTVIREALLNGEKFESFDDDDERLEWLFKRALARTGVAGRFDPLIQIGVGLTYERDLTTVTAGPYLGNILQNVGQIALSAAGRNSPNTNTSEFNAMRAAYRLILQPAAAGAISTLGPAGPISANISRMALFYTASYDTANTFAESIVGEKGRYVGDPPWWEMGD